MGNDVSAWLNKLKEEYTKQIQKSVEDQLEKNMGHILKSSYIEYFKNFDIFVNETFKKAIDRFYSSYTPVYYKRNESLYNVIRTEKSDDGDDNIYYKLGFEPSEVTPLRDGRSSDGDGNGGLYDQVFRKGWHGGADKGDYTRTKRGVIHTPHPDPGTPYWRAPRDIYTRWGAKASMAGTPPLEDIKSAIYDYQKNRMQNDFNQIYLRNIKNSIRKIL